MEYKTRPINPAMTPAEILAEIKQMHEELYRYGRSIDRPRMWDLQAEYERLTGKKCS